MGQYFNLFNSNNDGKLAISSNVFTSLSSDVLNDLYNDEQYSSMILKSYDKKESKIKVNLEKDKVNILVSIIITKDADLKTLIETIKERIYSTLYRSTEISNINIDVDVLLTV